MDNRHRPITLLSDHNLLFIFLLHINQSKYNFVTVILQMNQVLDAMFERKVAVDEIVIRQGDDGDNFYVIES